MRFTCLVLAAILCSTAAQSGGWLELTQCGWRRCGRILAPVCGSDGESYSSDCDLVKAACSDPTITMVHRGRCTNGDCGRRRCGKILAPVCGSDGESYDSDCFLAKAACRDPTITMVHRGRCVGKK